MISAEDRRIDSRGLEALAARIEEDLGFLCHPGKDWVPERPGVSDVVIIGGGMCGMAAWFALRSAGLRRMRVLDRGAAGLEGPWLTYAQDGDPAFAQGADGAVSRVTGR